MSRFPYLGLTLLLGWFATNEGSAQTIASAGVVPQVVAFAVGARTSQPEPPSFLLQPARLTVTGMTLAHAVAELAERSGVPIAYSPSRLGREGKVDCECEELTVAEALDHLLAQTAFRHVEIDGHVVIIPRAAAMPLTPDNALPVVSRQPVRFAMSQATPARWMAPVVAQPSSVTAQPASIAGTVTDGGTGGPLSGATVMVEGTHVGAMTTPAGRYLLRNVPAGAQTVVASMIGYSSQSQPVTVVEGEVLTVNFALSIAPIQMDELVVTATGERRRAEVANVVGTVNADAIVRAVPIASMSQLLTARSPSVQVISVNGTVGGQSRIRIRGQSSMSLSNDPIVYLDGIRVASGYGGGMDSASRLDDLNPAEIQTIDVLKGPAAVALYGTDAANGVIIITTKRGRSGAPQWNLFAETGITEQPSGFPTAYYSAGHRTDTGTQTQCLLLGIANGTCVQDELRSFNLLEDPRSTPFATGRMSKTGVQISGGSEDVRYFLSADLADEIGTLRMPEDEQERIRTERGVPARRAQRIPNSLRTGNFRSNISAVLSPTADLDVSFGYVDRSHRLTTSGGSTILGLMRNALQGRGYRDELGGWWSYPAGDIFSVEDWNEVGRLIGGVGTNWRPVSWLATRARVGIDRVTEENSSLQRRGEGINYSTYREGQKSEGRITQSNYTVEVGATATYDVSPQLNLRSSIGGQYFRNTIRSVSASGTNLSPGTEHVGGAAVRSSSESNSGLANLGAFVEQVLGFNDRLYFTGSVRTDQNSAFGRDLDAVFYPRASISWIPSREPFFPEIEAVSSLRLRLAYGTSGVSPGTLHALRYFTSLQTFEGGVARPGLQFHAIGNVDLEPERTTEIEAGLDIELLDGRASGEFTHYRKKSRDALVNRPLAPSLGLNSLSRFENLGSVQNTGWEGTVNVRLLARSSWGWDATVSASVNENELVKLGEGVTPVVTFAGTQAQEGYPLWGRWARPILDWGDANGNGIIESTEVQVGDQLVYLGPSMPTREAAVSSTFTLLSGSVRIGALLDYRGGHLAYNRSEADRCTGATNCRAVNDPTAPLLNQVAAVAASTAALGRTHAGFFEDGAYTTLREVSLSVQVPQRFAQFVRAGDATVTVAGRNLHLWTGYSGISPEGSWVDNMGLDMNLVPVSRYWTIRVNANY